MKVVTYLGLTLLSIFVQFTVISFIEGKIKKDESDLDDHPVSSHEQDENTHAKPHALYFRSQASNLKENNDSPSTVEYINISLLHTSIDTTTEFSSFSTAVIDEVYDENTSLAGTTDVTYTTTEFDNVTDITLFDKKNHTTVKPNIMPKKSTKTEDCNCNLLFKVCDINCCCDSDCFESDLKIFKCNEMTSINLAQEDSACHADISNLYWHYSTKIMDMFCIAKTNLPARRTINTEKHDQNALEKSFKWHSDEKQQFPKEFKRKTYVYSDNVWVLKNGSIRYIDLPIPIFNDYCTDRKPLTFLKEETITCSVKLKDLEMIEIIKASQEATLISVLESSSNISTLNCSTLHCTNWTVIVCEGGKCVEYNRTLHEPSCTDIHCTNLALEFDYIFYYRDFKILNATIKLHIHKILKLMPYMIQRINVRFVMTNESIGDIVRMSGNPGYLDGLPVIVSYSKENHSETFFNTSYTDKYIVHPTNKNGLCTNTTDTNNYLTFNTNKRMKCRFEYEKDVSKFKDTNACKNINNDVLEFFGVYKQIFISPYGNPLHVNDRDWLPLLTDILDKEPVYGEYNERRSKLHCYNMITRMSYVFTFADTGEDNKQKFKISSAKINLVTRNITFNIDDISTVLTIDTIFIDETKPSLYEYAAGPHLNIHLPEDFFFPFPNSRSNNLKCNVVISILFSSVLVFQQIK